MSVTELRRKIKQAIDDVPEERLTSLADFIAFLARQDLADRIRVAEEDFRKGRGANWRAVRNDV
jgi:hypothetical protein